MPDTVASVILLAAISLSVWLLPWSRLPQWATVLVPVAYAVQVLTLTLAAGGSLSGTGIVILIPLVWTALFHKRWESFVVVLAIVEFEIVTSLVPTADSGTVIFRRILFWSAIGFLVSYAAHGLRDRIISSMAAHDDQYRRTASLVGAAEKLTASLSPLDVLHAATQLAAELTSPSGVGGRRAQYMRVSGDTVHIITEYDEADVEIGKSFDLSDHPYLTDVMTSGLAIQGAFDPGRTGPTVRWMMEHLGITHTIYVPVYCAGVIDGVLTVPLRNGPASEDLFNQCQAVGHLTELALSNALAHESISELATTDALTGIFNRRGFEQTIANRPGRRSFAIVAIDLDGLKRVNDTMGHAAGDALLLHVAATLSQALRRGDVLARIGGDEFTAFLFDADEEAGKTVTGRMLAALEQSPVNGEPARISAGIAFGFYDSEVERVQEAADAAMYLAKRRGGARFEVASSVLDQEMHDEKGQGEKRQEEEVR